jgi:hypothetical protein
MFKFSGRKNCKNKLPSGVYWSCAPPILTALWLALPVLAVEPPPTGPAVCAELADAELRLACFDRLFKPVPKLVSKPVSKPPGVPSSPVPAAARPAVPKSAESGSPAPLRVVELGTTPRGRGLIELEDGSLWLQRDDRPLALSPGDAVLIRAGLLGSQYLRPASGEGRSAKVERLR